MTALRTTMPELLSEIRATNPKRIAYDLVSVKALAKTSEDFKFLEPEDLERIEKSFMRLHCLLMELAENAE